MWSWAAFGCPPGMRGWCRDGLLGRGSNANAKELLILFFFFLIENEKAVFFFLTWKLTEEENSLGALRLSFRAGPCSLVAAAGTLADPHPALHPEV